jgi:hypothetical protein
VENLAVTRRASFRSSAEARLSGGFPGVWPCTAPFSPPNDRHRALCPAALYKHLTDPSINNPLINLNISPYGGAVNAVAQSATSIPHRDAAFKMLWSVQWSDPADDNANVAWVRNSFSEVFSATGGVPVISDTTDGCYINYVDSDMRDPAYNKSTTPWSTLYYKDAYPLLQAVKKAYDPTNFFHHRMSVELPS